MSNNNDPIKNLTTTKVAVKPGETRHISVIRDESGYGFTLSRSIIYAGDQKNAAILTANSSLNQFQNDSSSSNQTEVVYVKHVRANGPAFVGGLREGDRPISINNESLLDKKYADVIPMIENSGIILELIVIPSFIQTPGSSTTKTAMPIAQTNANNTSSNAITNTINATSNVKPELEATMPILTNKNISNTSTTSPNTLMTATSSTSSNLTNSSSSISSSTTSNVTSAAQSASSSMTETASSVTSTPSNATATSTNTETSAPASTVTSQNATDTITTSTNQRSTATTPTPKSSTSPNPRSTTPGNISSQMNNSINLNSATTEATNLKHTAPNFFFSDNKSEINLLNPADLNLGLTSINNTSNDNSLTEPLNLASVTIPTTTVSTTSAALSTSPNSAATTPGTTTPALSTPTTGKPSSSFNIKYNNLINNTNGSIGSGISALLYSLLKNSSKASTEPPPELNNQFKRVNRLKESNFRTKSDQNSNSIQSPTSTTPSSITTPSLIPPLATNESSSLSSTSSSPNTKTKLKNLQDALFRQYSNDTLEQTRNPNAGNNLNNNNINDPTRSFIQSGDLKQKSDSPLYPEYKFSYQQYYLDNKQENNHQTFNYGKIKHPFYYDSKHPFYYDNRLHFDQNNANSYSEDEINRNRYLNMIYNSYPTPFSSSITSSSHKTRQQDLAALIKRTADLSQNSISQQQQQQQQMHQNNNLEFYPHHHHYQLNRSSFNNSSVKSQSSTTTGGTVTMLPQTDSFADTATNYNLDSKIKNKLTDQGNSPNKESVLLNAVAAAAAAVNKASPQLFSKYIETVHKAMHGNRNANDINNNSTKQQTHHDFKPSSLPPTSLRDNYTTPYEMYTTSDQDLIRSKRFVDQCRQIFEQQQKQKLLQQQLAEKQFYTLPSSVSKANKAKIKDDYSLNSNSKPPLHNYPLYTSQSTAGITNKPTSTSLSPVRSSASTKLADLTGSVNRQTIDLNNIRASSLGFAHDYQQPSNSALNYTKSYNQDQLKQHPQPYQRASSSHFNHFNRASYKGECKRMMAKGHMETVAERAARFEDIDIERYNRMKNKLYELELQQQKEIEAQYRLEQQQQQHEPILHKPVSSQTLNQKSDNQTSKTESFVNKLKNLRPVNKNNQTTSSDSSIIQTESKSVPAQLNKQPQTTKDQDAMWNKYEPFIAKYYNVGNPPSSNNNNVKLAANFISNNSNNNNMLTNFVGDISGNNMNKQQDYQHMQQSQYYHQQHLFYLNNKLHNETIKTSPPNQMGSNAYGSSFARRELLLNELKQHQQQVLLQQQQNHENYRYEYDDEDLLEQERLYYKRRSITSSPVRYNFNSKSSPPVIMRIDSAKTAKLNRLRSYEQQQLLNESNNYNLYEQVNTPSSTIQSWPNNNLRNTSSSNKSNPNSYSTIPNTKSLAHYNFLQNNSANNSNTFMMTSDVGETTSTDSDIGTSPSGTTLASPPSSPQQQQQLKNNQKINSNGLQSSPSNNSIIRHHSYLNAVQLNDFKLNQQIKSNNFATINENEIGSPNNSNQQVISDETKYYYSPSATVIRQQKLLQQKQQQHHQLIQIQNRIKALNEEKLLASLSSSLMARTRSKSSNQMHQSISLEQDYNIDDFENNNKYNMDYNNQLNNYRIKTQTSQVRHPLQQRSQTITASTTDENDDNRNNSYLKATNKQKEANQEHATSDGNKKISSTTPLQSRNTSIKKLKNFFGEKTPVVLQAVENKNIIASDEFLSTLLETIKEGVLNCKIVSKDGKRSSDRSWRPAWAVLKKSALFLCKEKKDNIMIPSVDSYPINLKDSTIDVAYDYNKRKCVFKVITYNNSEYLFQTADNESMMEWIRAMQESSTTTELNKTPNNANKFNEDTDVSIKYNHLITQQQMRHNWMTVENNSSNSLNEQMTISTNNLSKNNLKLKNQPDLMIASSPEEYFLNNSQMSNFNNNNSNMSPLQARKGEDTSPRRDNSNRRWVRQMTRRIKDFMTNTNTTDEQLNSHDNDQHNNDSDTNRNFGVPLDKCEPSSTSPYVPVVIEVCTRLIELHIIDEGVYRKVGQKQVVNALRAQLNRGILNIDVSDYNWDNPHAVVSLLKCFLNELPDSLTTSQFYNEFIQMCRIDHHHIRLIAIKKLLRKLSIYNYETLRFLSAHLRRVAAAYQHNKMTIKNLCIAFSQSLIRLNEANCETIKSDHVSQSLLIELILIYHDWLFDSAQMDNVPDQIKDIVETQLFQQYCSYIEPMCYTDLLLNIMKSIRSRWYSTNSSITSSTSNTVTAGYGHKNMNLSNSSSNEHDFTNSRQQQSSIQFRSNKKEIFRNAKSASVLNSTQTKNENQKAKQKKQQQNEESLKSNDKHVRSKSVDIRFKTIGMLLTSSSSNGSGLLSKQSKSKTAENRKAEDKKSSFKYKTEGFKQKQRTNINTESVNSNSSYQQNSIKFKKFQPLNRKSYGDLIKSTLFEDFNLDDSDSNNKITKCSDLTNKSNEDENKFSSNIDINTNINEKLDEQFINFKLLEKKSEQEREKLSNLMKKLEIDLMNAKMDLLEEDYVKSTPINMLYPNICVTSPTNGNGKSSNVKLKPLPSQIYNNNPSQTSTSSSSSTSVTNSAINKDNKPVAKNKYLLSASYSSSASTSSGIVVTTGPSSSSSSCVSTSPPLEMQQKFLPNKPMEKEAQTLRANSENPSKNQTPKQSKNVRLLLINRPRKLPKRRHTIGSSYDSIVAKTVENFSSISSSSSYLSSGDDNYVKRKNNTKIIGDNNLDDAGDFHDADDDERADYEYENNERRKKLVKSTSSNKENLELNDQLNKIISSRSINFLPSLTFFKENNSNILFPGPLENKNITKRRTSSRKKSLYSSINQTNNSNKKVILNLSSLSMSASSITSSSTSSLSEGNNEKSNEETLSINMKHSNDDNKSSNNSLLIKNTNMLSISSKEINKIDDQLNLRLSTNFDEPNSDSIKLDNYMKQSNIKFNCTFESLI